MTDITTTDSVKGVSLRRAAKIILPCLLGSVCLYYIIISFQWAEIWRILQHTNILIFLVSSVLATLAFWLLRTARWAYLLRDEQLDISFLKLYLYTAVTVGFANFTPFQSGEALKVEMFRKYGGTRLSGYTFFLFEKLLDLAVIALLSLTGIYTLFDVAFAINTPLVIAGLAIVLVISAVAMFFLARKWQAKIYAVRREVLPDVQTFAVAFLLTLASWAAMITGWKYILQSVGIYLTVLQTTSVISLTTVVSIISLVPGAVGVSEVSIAALLSQIGYETSIAQTGAMLMGIYSLVILVLTVVHLVLLKTLNYADNRIGEKLKQVEKNV
ncbi:MAG: flippase-like domain-containing protein [Acidobacteriota bacterium]|nr:flippase-like domain-containing protein [Acidobacteriota bacterium]